MSKPKPLSIPKPMPRRAMIHLVSPDCVLYVISDTDPDGPDVQQLRQLRSDMPPPKNFNQLSGWTTGPHGGRGKAGDWQHLDDVKWIDNSEGDLIPLVGSAKNAMQIFNATGWHELPRGRSVQQAAAGCPSVRGMAQTHRSKCSRSSI